MLSDFVSLLCSWEWRRDIFCDLHTCYFCTSSQFWFRIKALTLSGYWWMENSTQLGLPIHTPDSGPFLPTDFLPQLWFIPGRNLCICGGSWARELPPIPPLPPAPTSSSSVWSSHRHTSSHYGTDNWQKLEPLSARSPKHWMFLNWPQQELKGMQVMELLWVVTGEEI